MIVSNLVSQIHTSDSPRIKRVCNHEAAHNVISRILGFNSGGLSVVFNYPIGQQGGSTLEPSQAGILTLDDMAIYMGKRLMVLFAGAIGEFMDANGNGDPKASSNEWENNGARDDYAKIKELLHALRNIRYPVTVDPNACQAELTKLEQELGQKTAKLVQLHIKLIHHIGDLLAKKVIRYDTSYELTEAEINNIDDVRALSQEDNS